MEWKWCKSTKHKHKHQTLTTITLKGLVSLKISDTSFLKLTIKILLIFNIFHILLSLMLTLNLIAGWECIGFEVNKSLILVLRIIFDIELLLIPGNHQLSKSPED